MKNIVIAVDGSGASVRAVRTAKDLFGDDVHYIVVHVAKDEPIVPVTTVTTGTGVPQPAVWNIGNVTYPTAGGDAEPAGPNPIDVAESVARRIAHEGGLQDGEMVGSIGDRAEAILDVAHEHDAAAIVLGTHDHGWFTRMIGASVADDVRKHADIPVLLVPGPDED